MHKQSLGIFLALIAMYIFSTIHIVCRWILMRNAFIDNGDTSMTTSLYLIRPPLWLTVLGAVVFTANTLVADSVLIWRCWTIWGRNWWVIVLPLCCTLAGAGEKSNRINTEHSDNDFSGLGFKSIQEQAAYFIDFATPYFALSLITTCLATLLIIFRILTMTDHTTRQSRGYSRVIEVVVESALLYSVAMAIFLPLLVRNSSNDAYAQAVVGQVTGIAPTLIVARVTLGFARPSETWQTPTTVFSTRSGHGTTLPANSYLTRVATGSATGSDAYEK
ncbi:hypothetical protein B0H14DRAFT_2400800 [Mycena olivaceomarginata]|nr:hypothetical protein B0H14DRAFT_2400800 [Mycena olivaceomarginata]